jgi:hypothetical protein
LSSSSSSQFHGITIFLTSNKLSKNFTISNGTTTKFNAYVGPILDLEPSSAVKHVNWIWPACLVGNGNGGSGSARGAYNVSIHQSFKWNGTNYYTVSDLPISVTNSISESGDRVDCGLLENDLLGPAEIAASNDTLPGQPWVSAEASSGGESSSKSSSGDTNGGSQIGITVKQCALFALMVWGMLLV